MIYTPAHHTTHTPRSFFRRLTWPVVRRTRKTLAVETCQGKFELPLDLDDSISKSLYVYGNYELDFMRRAMRHVRTLHEAQPADRDGLIDIGANHGITSIGMLNLGECQRSLAIEPEPRNFELLKRNIGLNGFESRIEPVNLAVSAQVGEVTFEISPQNLGDHRVRVDRQTATVDRFDEQHRHTISVPSATLDAIVADHEIDLARVAVIWCDVQGHESFVFEGGSRTLAQPIPVVSEVWPYGILRSGKQLDEYAKLVASIWPTFWVEAGDTFRPYACDQFRAFLDEIGTDGQHTNVIFTQMPS